ncbi:MAG: hypothetical protein ACRDT4_01630 [Micromonosporaceae bacterium]
MANSLLSVEITPRVFQRESREDSSASTAAELTAELAADEDYVRRMAAEEEDRQARVTELRRAEQPIVRDLRRVGCDVESVWDLGYANKPHPQAIPVLLKHTSGAGGTQTG